MAQVVVHASRQRLVDLAGLPYRLAGTACGAIGSALRLGDAVVACPDCLDLLTTVVRANQVLAPAMEALTDTER